MLRHCYSQKSHFVPVSIDPHVMQYVPVSEVCDGVLVRTSKLERMCVEDNNKEFTMADFSLSNIIATGATHLLNPVTMRSSNVDSFASRVDEIGRQLDAAIVNQSKPSKTV